MSEYSILKDMGAYKNKIVSTLINCDAICELLLDKNNYAEEEVEELIYSQVFPYLYVDETQTEVKTYICCEIDIQRVPTNTVKDMKVILWVYSHRDGMKYSKKGYLGTKVDILVDMIEEQLRESNKFGIGKLELTSCTYFIPNNKYYGKQLIFNMPDFKVKSR